MFLLNLKLFKIKFVVLDRKMKEVIIVGVDDFRMVILRGNLDVIKIFINKGILKIVILKLFVFIVVVFFIFLFNVIDFVLGDFEFSEGVLKLFLFL